MIQFEYDKPIEPLFNKLKSIAQKNNGEIIGNSEKGNFDIKSVLGTFQGNYFYNGRDISIKIIKKPFLISLQVIEREIKKFLSNN